MRGHLLDKGKITVYVQFIIDTYLNSKGINRQNIKTIDHKRLRTRENIPRVCNPGGTRSLRQLRTCDSWQQLHHSPDLVAGDILLQHSCWSVWSTSHLTCKLRLIHQKECSPDHSDTWNPMNATFAETVGMKTTPLCGYTSQCRFNVE